MNAVLLDELLADFGALESASATVTPAKAANPAKSEQRRGLQAQSESCEELRILANSQTFAAVRKPENAPQSEQRRGSSQNSQVSHGLSPSGAPIAWTDTDIASFLGRRDRLMRWGWTEADAERLAERLVLRDREGFDDRVSCADCCHARASTCRNYKAAGLGGRDVGRFAEMLQRCPGFKSLEGD